MKWLGKRTLLFVMLGLFLFCQEGFSIDFSRVNIAWRYDVNASLKLEHRVVTGEDDSRMIFLHIKGQNIDRWKWQFLVQEGYETEEDRKIEPVLDTLSAKPDDVLLRLILPITEEDLLVVKIIGYEQFLFYDIPLKIGRLSFPNLYPVDAEGLPVLSSYVNRSGLQWAGDSSFLVMRYPERFQPAEPPMAEKSLIASAVADTAFYLSDSTDYPDDYFYVVRRDSLATTAVTILKAPPYFPEYRRLDELIESMLYITTEQEKKALLNSRTPKASFDSFWMNTFSTKSFARNAIRRYYNKVEQANMLFTDFMPGWKTDRGMIYIVFGPPDEVYRTRNSEEWYYSEGVSFEFNIISSFFAPSTYTLRRSLELEELWLGKIAAIRSGIE